MFHKMHLRSGSSTSKLDRPVDINTSAVDQPDLPPDTRRIDPPRKPSLKSKMSHRNLLALPNTAVPKFQNDGDKPIPHEMIPALTLFAAHGSRVYNEGYFMLLAELDNRGEPIQNRQWIEVFGTLQGTILSMWEADALEEGRAETSFINFSDGYMRSIESLGADLENVIVLSTTMKNRYLLQFPTKKLFNEWTAALRLASFERTCLQEAYTGALLSSMGSKLHGIRALLSETRAKTETFCNVRFGVGMPWKRVFAVVTPNICIKDKKERKRLAPHGKVELYNDPKDVKKKKRPPLAVIHSAFSAFAVFPEKSVLVSISSMIKMECTVEIDNDKNVQESAVFIMPEQHPGIHGFETLIRFLIPLFDVYALYGRPKRLNADKNDMNSLLFGMPTLPKVYYLDVIDVYMLAALPESQSWSLNDWNIRLKELIARKMTTGYRGCGDIGSQNSNKFGSGSRRSSMLASPNLNGGRMRRDFSDPGLNLNLDPLQSMQQQSQQQPQQRQAPRKPISDVPELGDIAEQLQNASHQRTVSEGEPRAAGILSPQLNEDDNFDMNEADEKNSLDFREDNDVGYRPSHDSYAAYSEYMKHYINRNSVAPHNHDEVTMEESDSDSSINVPIAGMDLNKPNEVEQEVHERDVHDEDDDDEDGDWTRDMNSTNHSNPSSFTDPNTKQNAYPDLSDSRMPVINRSPDRKPSGPRPEASSITSAVNNIGNPSSSDIWDSESHDAETDDFSDSYSRINTVPTYKPTPVRNDSDLYQRRVNEYTMGPQAQPNQHQQGQFPGQPQQPPQQVTQQVQQVSQGIPQGGSQGGPGPQGQPLPQTQPPQGYPYGMPQGVQGRPMQAQQMYPMQHPQQMHPMQYYPNQGYRPPQMAHMGPMGPVAPMAPMAPMGQGQGMGMPPPPPSTMAPGVQAPAPGGPRFPQHVNRGGSAKTGPVLKPVKDLKSKRAELMDGDFGI